MNARLAEAAVVLALLLSGPGSAAPQGGGSPMGERWTKQAARDSVSLVRPGAPRAESLPDRDVRQRRFLATVRDQVREVANSSVRQADRRAVRREFRRKLRHDIQRQRTDHSPAPLFSQPEPASEAGAVAPAAPMDSPSDPTAHAEEAITRPSSFDTRAPLSAPVEERSSARSLSRLRTHRAQAESAATASATPTRTVSSSGHSEYDGGNRDADDPTRTPAPNPTPGVSTRDPRPSTGRPALDQNLTRPESGPDAVSAPRPDPRDNIKPRPEDGFREDPVRPPKRSLRGLHR